MQYYISSQAMVVTGGEGSVGGDGEGDCGDGYARGFHNAGIFFFSGSDQISMPR